MLDVFSMRASATTLTAAVLEQLRSGAESKVAGSPDRRSALSRPPTCVIGGRLPTRTGRRLARTSQVLVRCDADPERLGLHRGRGGGGSCPWGTTRGFDPAASTPAIRGPREPRLAL